MVYNLEYIRAQARKSFVNASQKDHRALGRLLISRYSNAVIAPAEKGGGGCFVGEDMRYLEWSNFWNKTTTPPADYSNKEHSVFYCGMFYGCWGHCITDNLRHIWPIVRNLLPQGLKLAYTTSAINEKLPDNFYALLDQCGIKREDLLYVSTPTKYKEVWFAEPSYWYDANLQVRCYTAEFLDTIDLIRGKDCRESSNVQVQQKIYLSRAGWHTNKPDFGESYVESAFQSAGYEIVRPEELSFPELIGMLSRCNCLAATEGSIAHNALFLPDNAKLVVVRKANYINDVQMTINQIRDLDVTIIDAFRDEFIARPREPWRGPFFVYVSKELANFLGISKMQFPIALYFRYFLSFLKMRIRSFFSFIKHNIF